MNLVIVLLFLIYSTAYAQNFSGYDNRGDYVYGKVRDDGRYTGYDNNGNYYYGRVKDNGRYSGYDNNGNYYYGRVRDDGRFTGYGNNGSYVYGRVRDNGRVSGYVDGQQEDGYVFKKKKSNGDDSGTVRVGGLVGLLMYIAESEDEGDGKKEKTTPKKSNKQESWKTR
jgi:hypothetical protein